MTDWLEKPAVLALHQRLAAADGLAVELRDEPALDSALGRPQQLAAYAQPPPDLADLAATLAAGLLRNRPFAAGNHRLAAAACETFLRLNGLALRAPDTAWRSALAGLAESRTRLVRFADWLRTHTAPERAVGRRRPAASRPVPV